MKVERGSFLNSGSGVGTIGFPEESTADKPHPFYSNTYLGIGVTLKS